MSQTKIPSDMSQQEVNAFHSNLASLWQKVQNLPLAARQALGLSTEVNTSQTIGNLIDNAEEQIDSAINNLPDDAQMSDKKQALLALKVTVPYHFSFGQKDQVWLNSAINCIVDGKNPNTSTVVSSTVPTTSTTVTTPSNPETSATHEVATSAKPPTPEA